MAVLLSEFSLRVDKTAQATVGLWDKALLGKTSQITQAQALAHIETYCLFMFAATHPHVAAELTLTDTDRIKYTMTKRANKPTPQTTWQGFVQVDLDDSHSDAITAYASENPAFTILLDMVDQGYKVTVSYQAATQGYVAAATGTDATDNAGFTLTGWSGSAEDALVVLGYKHDVVTKGNWQSVAAAPKPKRAFR